MGKLLFDESPLVVQPTLAKAIGLNEAIILQQLHYWMRNSKSGRVIDGRRWIFNSLSEWKEQFTWWSESTIYRTLENLEEAQLVETGNFNRRKGDRTKWYTLNYATYALLEALIEYEPKDEPKEEQTPDEGGLEQHLSNWNSNFHPETTLPETSAEISPSLSLSAPAEDETPSPKRQALETLEKAFFQYGGTLNPALIERFFLAFDSNPDHPKERLEHALKRLSEKKNFFSAIDAYREWSLPKPPTYPQRREQFSRPSAPAPIPKKPLEKQLEEYYALRRAKGFET